MTFSPVSVLLERFWREKSHKLMVFFTLFSFPSSYHFLGKKCSRMYLKINRSGKNAVTWPSVGGTHFWSWALDRSQVNLIINKKQTMARW